MMVMMSCCFGVAFHIKSSHAFLSVMVLLAEELASLALNVHIEKLAGY